MPKYGVQLHINAILLLCITTFITRIFSLDEQNLQNQRYDYIDVAKETAGGRSKGHTTRIFTTEHELDEKFWLKYLGEDFRHAVHLQVDEKNNILPMTDIKPPTKSTLNYKSKEEKRTRFVRQPTQDENKQLPVEQFNGPTETQYPTENPETFETEPTNTETTTTPPPADKTTERYKKLLNNKQKTLKLHKDKSILCNKFKQKIIKVKPSRNYKTLNEPIVVNLPEIDDHVYQINEEHAPLVVQIPPVIYHQKTDLYPEEMSHQQFLMSKNQLYNEEIPNMPLNNKNMAFYSYEPVQQNTQNFYPPHQKYTTGYVATQNHQPTHFTNLHKTRLQQKQQQQQHLLTPVTQRVTHNRYIKQTYPYQAHSPLSPVPPSPPPQPSISLPNHSITTPFVKKPSR